MPSLLIGTHNLGKQTEILAILDGLGIRWVTPEDLGLVLEIPEPGPDYATHARTKAIAYALAYNHWTLSDDSGLEVAALGGVPGLGSARLGGEGKADADRRRVLLEMLRPHPRPWKAQFRATVALSSPAGEVELAEGFCPGEVIPTERGSGGFGYDPVFLLEGVGLTMAELSMDQKNRLSHRARAIQALLPALKSTFLLQG